MPSLFPELLDFPIVAAMVLRAGVSIFFLLLASRLFSAMRVADVTKGMRVFGYVFALLQLTVSGLLLVGLYLQAAALGGAVLALLSLFLGIGRGTHKADQHVQVLLFIMCVALAFLGPGVYAIDLPL